MMSTFPASLLILNGKGANEPQLREAVNLLRDEGIDIHEWSIRPEIVTIFIPAAM